MPRQSSRRPPRTTESTPPTAAEPMRLQRFLASAGVDSRRNCEAYIRDGRVMVNRDVVSDPAAPVDPSSDTVELDGELLRLPQLKYYLLNKPKGVLCTNRDPSGRPRAVDLVPSRGKRLFTVGRLDENTEGLLLLTNDGDLAERLAHPRYEVLRKYRAQVAGVPTRETLASLRRGMHFSEGFFRFRAVHFLKRKGRSAFLEIELREGKNREVRRLLARAGHKVISLERIAFGPLKLGRLQVGECRELRPHEVKELQDFVINGPRSTSSSSKPKRTGGRKQAAGRPSASQGGGSRDGKPASGRSRSGRNSRPAGQQGAGRRGRARRGGSGGRSS